ncbi:uncharacterized protein N7479_006889 [Penicillium vulpinum]|uniref:Uncharacterized protein n=1 Tax=Penicillium vulpinum TaxID=29845 RepID=A0A1V6S3B5_9EURO|nr:uncharacterized protein N7479_006889 [Penicillium vulpinum]KAJ5959739.1 hypothetical protein N7479_006889 [Penicillium vulpinum]OQE08219.1 hypothetical protein PENVUL_c010G02560 [Penicillium vulpinum]
MPFPLKTIYEDPREEWADDEIHWHYNMPMIVVRARPHVLMRCNVCCDTASVLKTSVSINKWINAEYFIWQISAALADTGVDPQWTELFEEQYNETWVQIQQEFDSIADLPERFLREVPAPPFQIAEVRIQTSEFPCYWQLCANTGRHMIHTSFWDLWKLILQQSSPAVGTFDVILKAPSHTASGEDLIDPWNMSLSSNHTSVISHEDVSYLGWEHVHNDFAPTNFTCLPEGEQRDNIAPASRGRSRSRSQFRSQS